MELTIGEEVVSKLGEVGTLTAFDGRNITVDFSGRIHMYTADAFEKGHLQYLKEVLQAEPPKPTDRIPVESAVLLIDPAPVYLSSVAKKDRDLVQQIFDECDKETKTLYESFQPKMVYPKYTSHSRSKYGVGYLCKHLDCYVFRVFSRNDVYKKRQKTGVTVLERNTAEVFRVIRVGDKLYSFTKNLSVSLGYYNNTITNRKWRSSQMGGSVFLNEVYCRCDCGYLNGAITDPQVNSETFLFANLLFLALGNNKAEIVFKNKAFASTCRIPDFADYLAEFSPRQIDLASKNDVLHALPFIKNYGISDLDLLRDLEAVMEPRRYRSSVYTLLQESLTPLGHDRADLDKRIMHFIKHVENFHAATYFDYLLELRRVPNRALTVQDYFDKHYEQRHDELLQQRQAQLEAIRSGELAKANEAYGKAARELAWIDREEKGYFILVPKTIDDFKLEGATQHNCVFKLRYYQAVIDKRSVIVFLRQKKDLPYVTIEFDYETFRVRQALGKYNKKLDPELYEYIVQLGKRLYCEKHTQQ